MSGWGSESCGRMNGRMNWKGNPHPGHVSDRNIEFRVPPAQLAHAGQHFQPVSVRMVRKRAENKGWGNL
jgi:hypothetical protein